MFNVVLTSDLDISNYTLILPSVSVGNVGQLATDLIINALPDAARIGYVHTAYLHPLVGAEAFNGGSNQAHVNRSSVTARNRFGNLSTCCEVFASAEHRLVLIQQRTPIIKGKSAPYRGELLKWIREACIGNVVLLTSSFAHQRLDSQIDEFLCTPAVDPSLMATFTSELNWRVLERNDLLLCNNPHEEHVDLPGGGIATSFYHECTANDIPLIILLKFCSEGDNVPDSVELASFLNGWLRITSSIHVSEPSSRPPAQSEWKFPASWCLMFGGGPPSTIF